MNLCGPYLFTQLKTIYNEKDLANATFNDIEAKLKLKLDRVEPDLVQRFRLSLRNQQPDETAEEFVQAVKLQADFCGFGAFRDVAIQDRILAGLRDDRLKEMLLKEEGLTLDKMDKLITTWNIARDNAHALNNNNNNFNYYNLPVGFIDQYSPQQRNFRSSGQVNNFRRPVHERLGFRPYIRQNSQSQNNNNNNNYRRDANNFYHRNQNHRYSGRYNTQYNNRNDNHTNNNNRNNQQPNRYNNKNFRNNESNNRYGQGSQPELEEESGVVCEYCGVPGHVKRKCFTLKNLKRDVVKFVDLAKPGTSSEKQLTDMMGRLTTAGDMAGSDSDDSYSEWNSGELQCMCVESINKISEPCLMNVKLDDILVSMEVDCGSTVTVMGKSQYFTLFDKPLKQCDKQLLVVNGNKLEIEGETDVCRLEALG
ncbi:uncharacterized protein DDB_G0287625-like isoform X1 [Culex quinquefasciatus]|uniref:uncharacterized protein DDB_G0287625-like isoform X1 n=1 Tax=Culex quinquefasciatus TaxID=7176 RepID=UPI0018E2CA11|nr:uncharacterized protein DDB_G0287625-like isoform X1 [Culex quinquefasciatus]